MKRSRPWGISLRQIAGERVSPPGYGSYLHVDARYGPQRAFSHLYHQKLIFSPRAAMWPYWPFPGGGIASPSSFTAGGRYSFTVKLLGPGAGVSLSGRAGVIRE